MPMSTYKRKSLSYGLHTHINWITINTRQKPYFHNSLIMSHKTDQRLQGYQLPATCTIPGSRQTWSIETKGKCEGKFTTSCWETLPSLQLSLKMVKVKYKALNDWPIGSIEHYCRHQNYSSVWWELATKKLHPEFNNDLIGTTTASSRPLMLLKSQIVKIWTPQ